MKSRALGIFKTVQKYYEKFYIRLDLLIKPAHLLFSQLVALILPRPIRQMLVIFSGGEFLNTVLYRNLGKKQESRSPPPKSEISNFHVVVVQRRQRNMYKKAG